MRSEISTLSPLLATFSPATAWSARSTMVFFRFLGRSARGLDHLVADVGIRGLGHSDQARGDVVQRFGPLGVRRFDGQLEHLGVAEVDPERGGLHVAGGLAEFAHAGDRAAQVLRYRLHVRLDRLGDERGHGVAVQVEAAEVVAHRALFAARFKHGLELLVEGADDHRAVVGQVARRSVDRPRGSALRHAHVVRLARVLVFADLAVLGPLAEDGLAVDRLSPAEDGHGARLVARTGGRRRPVTSIAACSNSRGSKPAASSISLKPALFSISAISGEPASAGDCRCAADGR